MTRDEVAPDDQIRFAVVSRKIDAVSPTIADLLEDLAEGALVERLAVHDNAVHVKNDCVESFHSHHGKLPALSEDLLNMWASSSQCALERGWRLSMNRPFGVPALAGRTA